MRELEPVLLVDLFPLERQTLLQMLAQLSEEEWHYDTICPGWSVKDIVLHLLGDDISLLSRQRDVFDFFSTLKTPPQLSSWPDLVAFLNEHNAIWVQAARRMSHQLACTFLALTGEELYRYFCSLDLFAIGGPVSWAGPEPAPVWFDIAREYTERWVHQQQIRDAVGRPGFKEPPVFAPVLETFVRALPHTFREVHANEGTGIHLLITGEAGGEWLLQREQAKWVLGKRGAQQPEASIAFDQETAWRLFTKGMSKEDALQKASFNGNEQLGMKVLDMVSIIA